LIASALIRLQRLKKRGEFLAESLRRIYQLVCFLAEKPEIQLNAFPAGVDAGDSLALEFDDYFGFVPELLNTGKIDEQSASALQAVDAVLERMSNQHDPDLWSDQAMAERDEWTNLREVAHCAKAQLEASGLASEGFEEVDWIHYHFLNDVLN